MASMAARRKDTLVSTETCSTKQDLKVWNLCEERGNCPEGP